MNETHADVKLKRCNAQPLIQRLQLANYIGPLALFVCGISAATVYVSNTTCVRISFCLVILIYYCYVLKQTRAKRGLH